MKNHTIIHTNPFGYISRCNCCQDLQLCLGNVVLVLGESDFANFKRSFFELNDFNSVRVHREGRVKRFTFLTSYSDMTLSLSKQEFHFTEDLLNIAELDAIINRELNPF
ncbi:MAG: hypothetical protein HRT58_08520 [Crocinitomicaceae bacterium]|nr:hypothetical protein [Flavobacteriales bacterium]NQZ35694.1 hypothetical protein [Crocinitomicaceae bacterium]